MNNYSIPVLYLFDNIFFPETIIPLVLNDSSSQDLVRGAYENDRYIALYSTVSNTKGIATAGKIVMINESNEEGKFVAIIQGLEKIQLKNSIQQVPYPIYNFSPYTDIVEPHILKDGQLEKLQNIFESWLNRHVKQIHDREVFLKEINSPKKLTYYISLFMIKDLELKMIFLENRSLFDRINFLDAILSGETPEFEDEKMAQAIKNFDRFEPITLKNIAN